MAGTPPAMTVEAHDQVTYLLGPRILPVRNRPVEPLTAPCTRRTMRRAEGLSCRIPWSW